MHSKVCIDKESFELEGKKRLLLCLFNSIQDHLYNVVCYGKLENDQVFSILDRVDRCTLMTQLHVQPSEKLMFQPEDHSYIVIYIAEGIIIMHSMFRVMMTVTMISDGLPLYRVPLNMKSLLVTDFLMARGYNEGNCLSVIYQSPETISCRGGDEVELYCVVNILSIQIHYKWHASDDRVFPSTPVIYVTKPGVYFCTVRYKDFEVRSRPTEISVLPGMCLVNFDLNFHYVYLTGSVVSIGDVSEFSSLSGRSVGSEATDNSVSCNF